MLKLLKCAKRSKKAKTKHLKKALKQFKMCGHRMGNGMGLRNPGGGGKVLRICI